MDFAVQHSAIRLRLHIDRVNRFGLRGLPRKRRPPLTFMLQKAGVAAARLGTPEPSRAVQSSHLWHLLDSEHLNLLWCLDLSSWGLCSKLCPVTSSLEVQLQKAPELRQSPPKGNLHVAGARFKVTNTGVSSESSLNRFRSTSTPALPAMAVR